MIATAQQSRIIFLQRSVGGFARRGNARRSGFTLVEVLATLLLLGIVIPVAMQGISLAMATASMANHRSVAAGLAESKLAELIATGDWLDGATSGVCEDNPDYQWQAVASNWTEASVVQLDVVISWQSARRGEEALTVSTLVYQSNASIDPTATSSGGS